jgi:hypothetical protein
MAVISETLTGKISNLGDSWDQMLVSVGGNTSGVFSSAISIISKAINKVTEFNNDLNTVSKFNLKSDWGQKLNRAINPFAEKGSTSTEKAIYAINEADKEVQSFVSSAITGSKSTSDFGNAIANLQKKGNLMIADFKAFAPEGLAGIKATYEAGIKALKDGRTAFANEAAKPAGAVFGTGKKQKDIKFTREDEFVAKSSINELDLFVEKYRATEAQLNKTPLVPFPKLKEKLAGVNLELLEFNKSANEIIQYTIANTFGQLGTSIGQALVNGGNVLNAVGQTILQGLTSFLSDLGSELIKYGTLAVIKGKLDLAILTGGPVAIAAGLAAIGVGVALKAASGAIGAAANKNKESYSAPMPQSSATISTSAAGSSQDFGGGRVVFEISGTNLIGVLNRAGAKLTRFG